MVECEGRDALLPGSGGGMSAGNECIGNEWLGITRKGTHISGNGKRMTN